MTTKFFIRGSEPDDFTMQLFLRVATSLICYDDPNDFQNVIFCVDKSSIDTTGDVFTDIVVIKSTGIGLIKFYDEAGQLSLNHFPQPTISAEKENKMEKRVRLGLQNLINKHFDLDELKMLCEDLDIDYENIAGKTKDSRVRELLGYMQRRGRIGELIGEISRTRQNIDMGTLPEIMLQSSQFSTSIPWEVKPHNGFFYDKEINPYSSPPPIQLQKLRNALRRKFERTSKTLERELPSCLELPSTYQATACFTQNYGFIYWTDEVNQFANVHQIPRFHLTRVEDLPRWILSKVSRSIEESIITEEVSDFLVTKTFSARRWPRLEMLLKNAGKPYGFLYHLDKKNQVIKRTELFRSSMTIGRDPHCDIQPDWDSANAVSRQHARIKHKQHSEIYLEDMGSKNGTKVRKHNSNNFVPLCNGEILLDDGDEFVLSKKITMRFHRLQWVYSETEAISSIQTTNEAE